MFAGWTAKQSGFIFILQIALCKERSSGMILKIAFSPSLHAFRLTRARILDRRKNTAVLESICR